MTKMRGSFSLLTGIAMAMIAGPALAQSATNIGKHGDWGTYSFQGTKGKVCYVLTIPKAKQPPTLDHGDMVFFVSQRPGQSGS